MKQMQTLLDSKGALRSAHSAVSAMKPLTTPLGERRMIEVLRNLDGATQLVSKMYNDDAGEAFAEETPVVNPPQVPQAPQAEEKPGASP